MAQRRRRKKNPKDNHAGLGAFLGSLVGGFPGHIVTAVGAESLGGVMTGIGWIAGGALGGYYGASKDRRGRSAVGGAIGGIFTPLGAALGGYLGGRKPDRRNRNPSTAATIGIAAGLGLLAVGGGYAMYKATDGGKRLPKLPGAKVDPKDALQGIVGNTTLEEATFMVGDIQQPILLRSTPDPLPIDDEFAKVPTLRVKVEPPMGEALVEEPAGVAFGISGALGEGDNELVLVDATGDFARYPTAKKAISYLITGLTPDAAQLAYELALLHIADRGVNWDDPAARDEATKEILKSIAPKVDWSRGLEPYAYGDAPSQAWIGVQVVGTVANQSYFNKRALGEMTA